MGKGDLACDPRGMISEAYRIDGISEPECRAIFFDWALGVPEGEDSVAHIRALYRYYLKSHPNHPMTNILKDGSMRSTLKSQRRGRRARVEKEQ